ncbi:MAG: sugar phosphate isomerase/epimerase [Desulfobacterales bacterium]|nr:sugar phosphate isomerase/epimerase [Desulfobacterales bacterium]
MRLGYSTNAFTRFSLDQAVEKIADLGFAGVEIMCDRPHLYPPDYDADQVAQIKALLGRHRLGVTNLNSFTLFAVEDTYLPSWIEQDPERRKQRIDHTRQCLHLAAKLGARNISVPPGGPLNGASRNESMMLFHHGIEAVAPLAEELGVHILVEPEPGLMIERTPEFLAFIRRVDSPMVGVNFDIGHFFCAGENPAAAFETLFEWVGHVHIEDIGKSRIHQHIVPGDGAIDFAEMLQAVKRLGYAGDISLELYPYVNEPAAAGAESLAFLRPAFVRAGLEVD